MKLSKLYTNKPDIFPAIPFNPGLNVVIAEVRIPGNSKKDTHNLGKSTLGRIIDFCLLSKKDKDFFLFKYTEKFQGFVFYLEIELSAGAFVTIRRSVDEATKISFKRYSGLSQDLLDSEEWDHQEIAFDKSRAMLDGWLDWGCLKSWSYRNILGYQIRTQEDYQNIFQLSKHKGSHADWKPFVAHILGFDADLIVAHYEKEAELNKELDKETEINAELGGSVMDVSKVEGLLILKNNEASKKQDLLDKMDFRGSDKNLTKDLVDSVDEEIATLNGRRYTLLQNKKKISTALATDKILFDSDKAKQLFEEVGILFPEQIKKDFDQLIGFNKAISEERISYLSEDLIEIDSELKDIGATLNTLGKKRMEILSFLSSTDIFEKYKQATNDLVTLRTDIASLEKQQRFLHTLQDLRTKIRDLKTQLGELQKGIEQDVELNNSSKTCLFYDIRLSFSEIVESVLDRKALLQVKPNRLGHLEFEADILDSAGNQTSAADGHTYHKLLCIAFDLAVLKAHLKINAPKFAFHDGVFESLDDRKKENLLRVLRQYADLGIQLLITVIDSDLPVRKPDDEPVFTPEEIVRTLHDDGQSGRLFRFGDW